MSMSTPTPTPLPRATDEVTQPSASESSLAGGESVLKGLALSPARWEHEALALAEEAELRDGAAAGALRYAAARIVEDRVGDATAAIDHLQLAVGTPPTTTFLPVLRALRVHALEAGSLWAAVDLLDVEIEASVSAVKRAGLLVEKAYIFEDRLLATDPARKALDEAFRAAPHHRGALVAAQAIAERAHDANLLRAVLERRLAASSGPAERARVLARLALLAEAEPGRLAESLGLYGRSVDEDPGSDAAAVARAGLRRVASKSGRDLELGRGITLEADALAAGPARAAWLAVAAALQRHRLGALEHAVGSVERALADAPDDAALLGTASEDHLSAGRWERALALLDRQARLTTDPEWSVALNGLGGHIAEHHCGDDAAAAIRFNRVLEVRGTDPTALKALERVASRTGDSRAQVALAVAAVGRASDSAERAALAMRAAELSETALRDPAAAVELARRALEAVPGYAPAVHLLERLYPALERWDEMLGVIESASTGGGADADAGGGEGHDLAARRLERLGTLYEERLGDPSKAMALFSEWAQLGTQRATALKALLRAAEKAGDSLVAAEAALRLGTEINEYSEAVCVAWRYRAATLYEERAAADQEAIRAYELVLDLAPTFRPALEGLARALRRRKSYESLVAVLSRLAGCQTVPAHASALELEAARLASEMLSQPESALLATGRALAADPACVDAADYAARLLQRLGRAEEWAAALGALAERINDPVAKAGAYRRQAEVCEWQLRRPREALLVIERSLAAHSDLASLLIRERLLQILGRAGEVAELQAKRLGAPEGRAADDTAQGVTGARIDLALRLAEPEEAALLLGRVLDQAPGQVLALEMQIALFRRTGRDRESGAALERLAAMTREPELRSALWRGALAARERISGIDVEALPLYERIVEGDPTAEALALFERLAVQRGDWRRVVLARRMLAERADDAPSRAALLWELGLAHTEAADLRGAAADFERALEQDESFLPALRAQARLRELLGETRAAAESYVREGRATKTSERAADCFRQAARLYRDGTGDDEAAAGCLVEVLALDPDGDADFALLESILRQRGEEDRLVAVLRGRTAAGNPDKRRDRLLQLALLLQDLGAKDAIDALSAAVELEPTSVSALLRMAELLAERERPAEAVATFRRAIAAASDPKIVSAAWIRIGDIADRDLGDLAMSVSAYRSALLVATDDIKALGGLVRGLVRQRDHGEAASTLRRLASVDPDRDGRVGHLLSLGELLAGAAEDTEGAAEALEEALTLDPTNDAAIDRLDQLLNELDEPSRFAGALTRYLEMAPTDTRRRMRLANLWSGTLGAPLQAIEELRLLIQTAPDHVGARAELARVLEDSARFPDAVTEHLGLLRVLPLRLESLQALRRLFERLGERGRAARALAALTALGAVEPGEGKAVRDGRFRWSSEPQGVITATDFDNVIRHPDERHPATALLTAMIEVIPRLYQASIEHWGVTKADRLGPRSDDPIRALVQQVAAVLNITETFEIYVARAGSTQVEVEATLPPALLVPAAIMSQPRQEAFLQLGYKLGRLRAGSHVAARIPPKDLGILVAAGVRTIFPDYGRGVLPEDKVNEMSDKIARALPRRQRRPFEQAALSFRDAGVFESERWRAGLAHTGHRAAMVISGDVLGAFDHIVRSDRRLTAAAAQSPDELIKAARANDEAVEMINFALGDELAALHARLGVS